MPRYTGYGRVVKKRPKTRTVNGPGPKNVGKPKRRKRKGNKPVPQPFGQPTRPNVPGKGKIRHVPPPGYKR